MASVPDEPTSQMPNGEADPLPAESSADTPPVDTNPLPTGGAVTFEDIARVSAVPEGPAPETPALETPALETPAPESQAIAPSTDLAAADLTPSAPATPTPSADAETESESKPDGSPERPVQGSGDDLEQPDNKSTADVDVEVVKSDRDDGSPKAEPVAKPEPAPGPKPVTPAASSPSSAPEPVAAGGTVQRLWGLAQPILSSAATATLSTAIKGTNWLTERLTIPAADAESSQTGALAILAGVWKVIRPLLVAVTLSLSRLFNQVLQWSLERVNPEAKSAAAAESSRTAFLITTAVLAGVTFLLSSLINSPAQSVEAPPAAPVAVEAPAEPAPGQALLDAVQTQVAQVTSGYSSFVDALDIDLAGDRIAVTLDDSWYRLKPTEQRQLARQMQQQASEFDFPRLTLLNERGERIARTPVVGDQLIFFQTSEPPPLPEVPQTLESPAKAPTAPPVASNSADSASQEAAAPAPSSLAAPAPTE